MNTAGNTAEKIIDISAYGYEFTTRNPYYRSNTRTNRSSVPKKKATAKNILSAREYYNRLEAKKSAASGRNNIKKTSKQASTASIPESSRSLTGILFGMLLGIIVTSILIFLIMQFSAQSVSADETAPLQKYYKSIELEAGDTLWELADTEMGVGYTDKREFISEIEDINHVDANTLHEGANLIIPYFA